MPIKIETTHGWNKIFRQSTSCFWCVQRQPVRPHQNALRQHADRREQQPCRSVKTLRDGHADKTRVRHHRGVLRANLLAISPRSVKKPVQDPVQALASQWQARTPGLSKRGSRASASSRTRKRSRTATRYPQQNPSAAKRFARSAFLFFNPDSHSQQAQNFQLQIQHNFPSSINVIFLITKRGYHRLCVTSKVTFDQKKKRDPSISS